MDIKALQKKAWVAACRSLVGETSALFRLFCSVSGNVPEDEDPSLLDFFCSNAQDIQQCLLCTSTLLSTIHCHPASCQAAHAAPRSLPQSASPCRSAQPGRRGIPLTDFHHKTELLALAQYGVHMATTQQPLRSDHRHPPPSSRDPPFSPQGPLQHWASTAQGSDLQ